MPSIKTDRETQEKHSPATTGYELQAASENWKMLPSEDKFQVHRERSRLRKFFIGLYLLAIVAFLVLWYFTDNDWKKHPPPSFLSVHFGGLYTNSTSPSVLSSEEASLFYSELGINLNYSRLQQAVYWAGPDREIANMSMTTSPGHTKFIIQDLKESYQIGEELYVMVHAKDFGNKSKRYGGDFFQAKLFWYKTKASVFGEVVDLLNGSYSVRFLLPWVGEAQVAVRLIHSSEAVQVLKHHRDTDSDRVFFIGYYEGPGPNKTRLNETVKCNVKWDKNGLEHMGTGDCCCEYNDPGTGESWRCQRPKSLPCSALVYHSMGGYRNHLTKTEKMFM
ncbi:NXPE family member 3-like [Ctenopharyngodon idella]|uniref:NXPE family member 3-like n=1 Tax=Ctenopharyngodon idella TaxID=7959 RepID=UPI002230F481|nr:NXPE family member 3-like [Ctenopharyngodon idella]